MKLKVIIEEQSFSLPVDPDFLQQATEFFDKMDKDMDQGWQMGRDWVEKPSPEQKLTIVADKLLTAIENDEKNLGMMMAGYIKSRAPQIDVIEMDVTGEMGHDLQESQAAATPEIQKSQPQQRGKLSKIEAMQQAGKEVSRVFKTGKQYKFSLYNPDTDKWEESPAIADKQEAENLREFAFKKRFDELTQ